MKKRLAGLLVPVFALRREGDFGIGDTRAVMDAIDFCEHNDLGVLQILPIHETVGDHSPYNPISARALSPALLTIAPDTVPGLLEETIRTLAPDEWLAELRGGSVKQKSVQTLKRQLLLAGFTEFSRRGERHLREEFEAFKTTNEYWLKPYSLFRLLIHEYEGNPNWSDWRPEHRDLKSAEDWLARQTSRQELLSEREGNRFIQWVAWRQWRQVKQHAEAKGVFLMGEMSFGVGRCSADVWAERNLFDLDWCVGTRPISYFDTNKDSEVWGQNWGLPAYRWDNHRSENFKWLKDRIIGESHFFHMCRLDHLRGYFRAYMFPWQGGATHGQFAKLTWEEARDKANGKLPRFVPGPDEQPATALLNDIQGREIISVIQSAAPEMFLIAEIMGEIPGYMKKALDDLALANLTFPQLERTPDRSLVSPTKFRKLSLVTYANHDHAPLAALWAHWHSEIEAQSNRFAAIDRTNLLKFAGWENPPPATLTDDLLEALQKALFQTHCLLAVLMSSDVLGLSQRFNLPGSYGEGTWCERLEMSLAEYQNHAVYGGRIRRMRDLIVATGRSTHLTRNDAFFG